MATTRPPLKPAPKSVALDPLSRERVSWLQHVARETTGNWHHPVPAYVVHRALAYYVAHIEALMAADGDNGKTFRWECNGMSLQPGRVSELMKERPRLLPQEMLLSVPPRPHSELHQEMREAAEKRRKEALQKRYEAGEGPLAAAYAIPNWEELDQEPDA